jgi:nucleoid DNA-binding protein
MSGMKDLVTAVALIRGIPKTQAKEIVNDVIGCMTDALIEEGEICIKDVFTIKVITRKGRTGTIDGRHFKSEDKKFLTIRTGSRMLKSINSGI